MAAERWAGGQVGDADRPRGPPPLLCPALLWVPMIESECFKDINERGNVALDPEEKTYQPAPRQKRGFFHRLFTRGVRDTRSVIIIITL